MEKPDGRNAVPEWKERLPKKNVSLPGDPQYQNEED
jgi:hypothetical protein